MPARQNTPRPFFQTCVGWPAHLHAAKDWLDSRGEEIDRQAFLPLVRKGQMLAIEKELGYDRHLRMADDFHVRYFRDSHSGIPFFVHSATEHVFATEREMMALDDHARAILDADHTAEPPVLILMHPENMAGQPSMDPGFDGDLEEEAIERAYAHQGKLIIATSGSGMSPWMQVSLRRALENPEITADSGYLWAGDGVPPSEISWLDPSISIPDNASRIEASRPDDALEPT